MRERCQALVLDMDGVLRRFDPANEQAVAATHGLPAGMLTDLAFEPDRLRAVLTGRASHAEWLASVTDALAAATDDRQRAEQAVAAWSAYRGAVVPEVLDAVRAVRSAGVPVLLASNATDWLAADLAQLGLTGEFDGVLNSSELGHAKPSAEFYAAACDRLGVPARLCLLVDDSDRNVRGARAAGLAAIRYTGPADLTYLTSALAPATA
ncbi:haloacid dehalogenase [Actinocatenispora thailandica]|uniref:Haloacid dehalogenase n=1 Tax=Actinocatenispora thailandica TaxID=227318 RepID=A0A7R7HX66_9ACTN|nr:HAD-IA family hydrolase [Actinocatenispora thailandica]BCJ34759.1 haloacid dehalogenase [Actinocatenispora thailandica]